MREIAKVGLACALLLCLTAGVASAQKEWGSSLDSRFVIDLQGYWPDVNTTIRLDSKTLGLGTEISFEDDLALSDREALPAFGFSWRIKPKHAVDFTYFELGRSGTRSLSREIHWGDEVYPIGTEVDSTFDSKIYRIGYTWYFYKKERSEIGLSGGFHVMDLFASIDNTDLKVSEAGDVTAPLPVIGINGSLAFAKKWVFAGRAQLFALEFEDFSGNLAWIHLTLRHDTFRNVGFGFGYDYFDINVDTEDEKFKGSVEYQFGGPLAFVMFRW